MKTQKPLIVVLLSFVAITSGALWLAHVSDQETLEGSLIAAAQENSARTDEAAKYGPRVELAGFKHDFGLMAVGEVKRHTFTIRNAGHAPLRLEAGDTTCKCTLSKLDRGELAPGETANIELVWKPEEPAESLRQVAEIHTNDEQHARIRFTVTGRVVAVVAVLPAKAWQIGEVLDDSPTEISGTIHSETLDKFSVTNVGTSNPLITAKFEPMDRSQLDRYKARCGYIVRTIISPEIPVGPFDEKLTIETNVPGYETHQIDLYGERPGPLRIQGKRWSPQERIFHLGNFSAIEGRSASLSIFLRTIPGKEPSTLKLTGVGDKQLQVTVKPDSSFESMHQRHYQIAIAIPPGSKASKRDPESPALIEFTTNVPGLERFQIAADFNAY